MTHLNIQQGLNIEVVSTNLIKKLYEAALSVPEPLEGELDAAYMSGNLLVNKSYRALVEYLTNRFDDLHINVTGGYYIPFHDSAVNDVLKNTIGDGIGVLDTLLSSVTNLNNLGLVNNTEITDFREGCLLTDPNISTSAGFVNGCTNLDVLGIPPNFSPFTPGATLNCRPTKIVISDWRKWISLNFNGSLNLGDLKHDICTLNSDNSITVVKNIILPEGSNFTSTRNMSGGFYNSTIEEVTLPTSATVLSNFQSSDITTLNFPLNSSLTTIILYCFYGCNKLTLDVSNLPLTITTIGQEAFHNCTSLTGELNLPNLISIGERAFYGTGITSIVDLGNITTVPHDCFISCSNLSSVTLSNDCKNISEGSFAYCSALTTINLGNVVSIGNSAFVGTKITSIPSNNSIETIGNSAFHGCNTTEINLPNAVSIGSFAFHRSENPITSLTLSHTLEFLGQNTFTKINDPNCCIYLPLITTTDGKNNKNWFSYFYNNGGYISTIGQLYVPNMENLYDNGHGSYPYWDGFASCLKALLIYLKDITDLYPGTFSNSNILAIVIDNIVPPTLNDASDGRLEEGAYKTAIFNVVQNWAGFIYVPDGYVNTYISAWENVLDSTREFTAGSTIRTDIVLKNRIKSISELPTYATEADWIAANRPLGLITAYMS